MSIAPELETYLRRNLGGIVPTSTPPPPPPTTGAVQPRPQNLSAGSILAGAVARVKARRAQEAAANRHVPRPTPQAPPDPAALAAFLAGQQTPAMIASGNYITETQMRAAAAAGQTAAQRIPVYQPPPPPAPLSAAGQTMSSSYDAALAQAQANVAQSVPGQAPQPSIVDPSLAVPAAVALYLPPIAERWADLTPEQQRGATVQAGVIRDQAMARQANRRGGEEMTVEDPLVNAAQPVVGPVADVAGDVIADPIGTGKAVAGSVSDVVTHPVDTLKTVAAFLGEAIDQPRQIVGRRVWGELLYRFASGTPAQRMTVLNTLGPALGPLSGVLQAAGLLLDQDDDLKQAINAAHEQGGPVQVWEQIIAGSAPDNPVLRALYLGLADTLADPVTYVAGAGKVGTAVQAVGKGTRLEPVATVAGKVLRTPDAVLNAIPGGIGSALKATGRQVERIPVLGDAVSWAGRDTKATIHTRATHEVEGALTEKVAHVADPSALDATAAPLSDAARDTLDHRLGSGGFTGQTIERAHAALTQEARAAHRSAMHLLRQSGVPAHDLGRMTAEQMVARTPLTEAQAVHLTKLRNTWRPYGDVLVDEPERLAIARTAAEAATDAAGGWMPKGPNLFQLATAGLARDALGSPINIGYSTRNLLSDEELWQLVYPGSRPLTSAKSIGAALRRDLSQSPAFARAKALGLGEPPREILTAPTKLGDLGGESATRRLFERAHLPGVGRWVGAPIEAKSGIDAALETSRKLAGWSQRLDVRIAEALPRLRQAIDDRIAAKGLPIDPAELDALLDGLPPVFSPRAVYDDAKRLGLAKGMTDAAASDLARTGSATWANLVRQARDAAVADVARALPMPRLRNADRLPGATLAFHAWMSRAAPLLLEEAIRRPAIAATWTRARTGLERMADREDYPDHVTGWLKAWTSPLGLAVYLSPATFAVVNGLWDVAPGRDEPDLTTLGRLKRDARKYGLGLWPVLDAIANLTGAYGDDAPATPLSFKELRLASNFLDLAASYLGDGDPYRGLWERAALDLREKISGRLAGIVPGIREIPASDPAAYEEDLIASTVLDQNPELRDDPARLVDILGDPESDEYRRAFRTVAASGVLTELWNDLAPLPARTRLEGRDRDIALNRSWGEAIQAGREPTADEQAAHDRRSLATAGSDEARGLDIESSEFYELGTQRQQDWADQWRIIAFGGEEWQAAPGSYLRVGNQRIPATDLLAMDEEQRGDLANAWVKEHGGWDELVDLWAIQRDFASPEHPEWAGYDQYRDHAYRSEDGLKAFRTALAEENPNFARALEEEERQLRAQGKTGTVLDNELNAWATSTSAYEAARGITSSVYDPAPIETVKEPGADFWRTHSGRSEATGSAEGGIRVTGTVSAEPTPGSADPRVIKLRQQVADYQAAVAKASAEIGMDVTRLDPYNRRAYENMGMIPKAPAAVQRYLDWVRKQPRGSDTSVEAYIEETDDEETDDE